MTFPCNYCGFLSPSNLLCQRCKSVRYCSNSCQKRDWKWNPQVEQKRPQKCGNRIQHKDKCLPPDEESPKVPNYWEEYKAKTEKNKILLDQFRIMNLQMGSQKIDEIESGEWYPMEEHCWSLYCSQRENLFSKPNPKFGENFDYFEYKKGHELLAQTVLRNHAPPRFQCQTGETYVAIGYVDLYQLLISEFPPPDEIQKPIQFIGIDSGFNQTARARVIMEMMLDQECSNRSILQAWFSTAMSQKTLKSFLRACRSALKKEIPISEMTATAVIAGWANSPLPTLEHVQKQFREKVDDYEILLLNCLKTEKDRMDYINYIFYGDLFLENGTKPKEVVGNSSFLTVEFSPGLRMRNSIFFHLDTDTFENYETSLMATIEKYLDKKLTTFRALVQKEKLQCKFRLYAMGSGLKDMPYTKADDESNAEFLRNCSPAVIDWSNIPDFFTKQDFFDFMNTCGSKSTIHTFHSFKWVYSLLGASSFDYAFFLKPFWKPYDLHSVAKNAFNLDLKMEFAKKPYLKKFLITNGLRYFPVSMMELVCSDAMKENYVKELSNSLKADSALRVERFGMKNHWSMLSRMELSSFDLIMMNKNLKQEDKDFLIEKHLKM